MEALAKKNYAEIRGTVKNVLVMDTMRNYAIIVIKSSEIPDFVKRSTGYEDTFIATGSFVRVVAGQDFFVRGEWVKHPVYGWRLNVTDYEEMLPTSKEAIKQYLSCGLFKGIGEKTAELIVEMFGDKTLDVIKNHPEKLTTIKGISTKKVETIIKAYKEYEHLEELMLILKPYNVSNKKIVKIYKAYGEEAITILKKNPYRLADEVSGFGFKTADQIARAFKIAFDDEYRIRAGILYVLHEAGIKDGHLFLTKENLIERAMEELATPEGVVKDSAISSVFEKMGSMGDVIIEGEEVFLPSYYKAEKYCGSKIRKLTEVKLAKFRYDVDKVIDILEEKNRIKYSSRQREAIRAIENTNLLIITGGPGTGKTTIIKAIIQLFMVNFPSKVVKLVAPTGRATKRMEEATGLVAKTIHRELEFIKRSSDDDNRIICLRNEANPIDADLLIVDESSMIDIFLFLYLVKAIKPGTKVVFVGDADQLPSVGPGNAFRDLIESGIMPVIRLDEIFRQKDTSRIIINANYIRKGETTLEWGDDFVFIREDDNEKISEIIRQKYLEEVKRCGSIDSVQVLSPFRTRTDTGVDNLNRMLQEISNPKKDGIEIYYRKKVFRENDKIMQVKNDYDKEVFNGDIGYITSIYRNLDGKSEAVVNMNGREIVYSQEDFEDLDLAYATTIHKAQGSEYDVVIIPLTTQHYIFLQRNIIYTAITRARKKVIIIGTPRALYLAIKRNITQKRNSELKERILYP